MQHYGIPASARASFAMYNTREDVDVFVELVGGDTARGLPRYRDLVGAAHEPR